MTKTAPGLMNKEGVIQMSPPVEASASRRDRKLWGGSPLTAAPSQLAPGASLGTTPPARARA